MTRNPTFARLTELVFLFLFSIPALSPLFTTAPTSSADGLLHLYRLVELNHLWAQGVFFSRWLPDLAYSYGLPLFNYYAPLVYYLTAPLHLLGIPFTLALNLSLSAALFVGAVGMFYFARSLVSKISDDAQKITFAALIAAIAYEYSPYLLFNTLHRANLAEQWALAFAPFALWRFFVLVEKPTARNWVLAVLTFAAVMLSHNVTSFLFAPLLFFFTLVCLIANNPHFSSFTSQNQKSEIRNQKSPSSTSRTFAKLQSPPFVLRPSTFVPSAFFLALALSAFFWLPALLERDFVQIARVIVTPDFDYRFNFVNPLELVSFLPRADTGRLNPSFPSTLGVIQILAAVAGITLLVRKFRTRRAGPVYILALAALAFIALMLSFSQPVWDNVSLLSFVQLPMRLRGLVALCLAPLISVFIVSLTPRWQFVHGFVLVVLVLFALPMLYPRYSSNVPPNPTLSDMFASEQSSGAFGTTSFGEYLPVGVQSLPDKSPYADAYTQNQTPNRLVIPEGVNICGNTLTPTVDTICTTSNDSWHAIYQSYYFPGWQVTLDNQPLEITPTPRTGLITFTVPHSGTLHITYAGTRIERLADYISIAATVLIAAVIAYALRKRARSLLFNLQHPIPPPSSNPAPQRAFLSRFSRPFVSFVFLALALSAFKLLYTDHLINPIVAHYNGGTLDPSFALVPFGDELALINVTTNRAARGQTLDVTLYWRALHPLSHNYSTFVHLTASDGTVVAQKDNLHPANYPTTRWDVNGYVADPHSLTIPSDLLPGTYQLRIGAYDPTTNTRLTLPNGADDFSIQEISIQ